MRANVQTFVGKIKSRKTRREHLVASRFLAADPPQEDSIRTGERDRASLVIGTWIWTNRCARLSIGPRCSLRGRKKVPRVETRGASRLCSRHASRIENNYRNVISRLSSPNANKSRRVYAYMRSCLFFHPPLPLSLSLSLFPTRPRMRRPVYAVGDRVLNPGLHAHAGLSGASRTLLRAPFIRCSVPKWVPTWG